MNLRCVVWRCTSAVLASAAALQYRSERVLADNVTAPANEGMRRIWQGHLRLRASRRFILPFDKQEVFRWEIS